MQELLWLLLPVAAASGWLTARRSFRKQASRPCFDLGSDYFKGLNFLLNEQPDKAIEVFLRMAEVDNDTVETHLALGSLFRRRGEVDRAIRIHQNLIARPTLSDEQRALALFELAEDYMKAGWLDRAEHLFLELLELQALVPSSLSRLVDIYQQEQDWEKAIEISRQYDTETAANSATLVAHYYCELAEKAMKNGDLSQFTQYIEQAFRQDSDCVRASIMAANKEKKSKNYAAAIKYYQQVLDQDAEYLPKVIEPLKDCYIQEGREQDMSAFLDIALRAYDGITPVLYKAEEILCQNGEQAAIEFMAEQVKHKPSVKGLQWLVELSLNKSEDQSHETLLVLRDLIKTLLDNKAIYECHHCGFSGKSMHWQCPGCKQWSTIKPIKGVVAE